ncbi:hypothetical protein [Klebsiella michiganensis]|uniref:hypothetical protein n=4 Tax=Klebsiella michiganensis TaxID=1134687 RepID=UPI00301970C4
MSELTPPLGTAGFSVLKENIENLDIALNTDSETWLDRGKRVNVSWKGILNKNAEALKETQDSITILGLPFTTLAEAQAAANDGKIPVGAVTWVRNTGDASLADEYINNGGTLEATGRSMPSGNDIDFAVHRTAGIRDIREHSASATYPDLISSGPIESLTIPFTGRKLAVIRDLATKSIDTRSYLSLVATTGDATTRRFLPATLLMMQGGDSWSYYEPINILSLSNGAIAETSGSMVRVSFDCGKTLDVSDTAAFTVIDVSGIFAPGTASVGISYTAATVMGSTNSERIQFVIPVADIEAAGYSADSVGSVYQYLRSAGADSYILVKTNNWNMNADLSRYAQIEIGEGDTSISCKALLASGSESSSSYSVIVSLYAARADYSRYQSDFLRLTADVVNRSTYGFTNYPMELKASLPVGIAKDDACLVLLDDAGNEYPCQFSGEQHPNKRLRAERSRHSDGSFATGSLFYTDTLAAGEQRNLELRAYSVPVRGMSRPGLNVVDQSTRTVVIGGYKYSFARQQNWCLTSVTDPTGTVHSIVHSTHLAGLSSGSIAEAAAAHMPSLRLITSGPVFVELEHIIFNGGQLNVPAKSVRFTTRYRLFANGKIQINVTVQADADIAAGTLAGVHSRISLNDGVYLSDNNAMSAWWTDATSGKKFTVTGMRGAGDEHRDGTTYGPTRPVQASILYPDGTSTRIYLGWKFQYVNDASFTTWPVPKDWTWVQEFWIDCDADVTLNARDVISLPYNRPCGFLGKSAFPTVIKQQLLRRIENHIDGSMDWWYSFDAAGAGGMPYNDPAADRVWQFAAISYDIMRHIRYGWSTVDKLYTTMERYVRWVYSATTINDIGAQYLAGKVLLQFASRLCVPPLEWLYKLAVADGNATVKTKLEGCIKSFADAIATYYEAHGGVSLNGSQTNTGVSNSNAAAMRILALGIYAGQDTDGRYLSAFNGIEALLSDTTGYMYVENVIKDGPAEILPTRNWLHYQLYAMNSYACACYLLNREPAFSMINYTLLSSSGEGGFHEIDYCVSESRRGSFNTYQLAMYNLLYAKSASATNLAAKCMDLFESEYGPQPGYPKRAFGFDGTTSESYAIADIPFVANGLADIWLREHFRQLSDKNF